MGREIYLYRCSPAPGMPEVIPFFAFEPPIRKIIYITTAIESGNRVIRKSSKMPGSFQTE
jgi:transposase-like protein